MIRGIPTFALLFAIGCQDYNLNGNQVPPGDAVPVIQVEPDLLAFWDVRFGASTELSFVVRNVGQAPLTVSDIAITDPSFSLVVPDAGMLLDVDEEASVAVRFSPLVAGPVIGQALVHSDDPETPEAPVDLTGSGLAPWLLITPETYDFGQAAIPCPDDVDLVLQNVGTDDLVIDGLSYGGDGQLQLVSNASVPLTLVPGAYTTVTVTLDPAAEGAITGTLSAASNDPRGVRTAVQTADPQHQGDASDHFVAPIDPPADILFAVDQSCSMDDDAVNLAANFQGFIDEVGQVTSGWHIGVVTYDSGCFNHGVLDAGTADLTPKFTEAVAMGEDWEIVNDEALLQLADRALANAIPGGCNDGFLRAGAPLHVIVVSDEPERSVDQAAAWTWSWWLSSLQGRLANPGQLTISGVIDLDGCNEGAAGYVEAIDATAGEKLSICTNDWAQYAIQLAQASVASAYSFVLTQQADGNDIAVYVDGVLQTSGWVYDPVQNAVVFDTLAPGSTVDVDYSVLATCP